MKKVILFILIFMFVQIINIPNIFADTGAKPSISIDIKNLNTDNYLIDLLVDKEDDSQKHWIWVPIDGSNSEKKDYKEYKDYSNINYNGNGEQYSKTYNDLKNITIDELKQLYDIDYDGWISESTRWDEYLLFADCKGNDKHQHVFSYLGTPEHYKVVIINNDTGKTKVTDEIHRKDFNSKIIIDYETMKVKNVSLFDTNNIKNVLMTLFITIAVELIIGLLFGLKKYTKLIVITNIVTNLSLQFFQTIISILLGGSSYSSYAMVLLGLEVVVFVVEYIIYKKYMKDRNSNIIIPYVILANLVSLLSTVFIIG